MTDDQKATDPSFLIAHGNSVFSQSKNARDWVENSWRKAIYANDSRFSPEERKVSDVFLGQSRLYIPKTYNTTQRILADVMETFFFDPDEIAAVHGGKNTPSEVTDAVKALINYRLNDHPINAYVEFWEAAYDSLKMKIGILKVYPKIKIGDVEKKSKKKNEDGTETEIIDFETKVLDFEPRMECVPPEDLFLDNEATWKDYWKYPIVHRMARTRDELKRSGFKNVDAVQQASIKDGTDDTKAARNWQASPFSTNRDVKMAEKLYDYEIWTHLDINGDGKLVSTVYHMLGDASGPSVIGKDPVENTLPYQFSKFDYRRPPFVIGHSFPEPHQMYGKNLYDFTEGLQKEVNALRNQDREAAALAIRKPILVNRDAGIDMMALVNRKIGGVVLGDETGAEAVRELQTSNPVINTQAISARNDQDYFEATSITPGQLGISTRDETATAVSNNQSNANKKIQTIVRHLAYTLYRPAIRLLLRLEQAYESDAFIQEVTGQVLGWRFSNDGVPAWQKIQGDFEITVELGVNKQSQLNKYLLIMDRMNQTNASVMQMVQSGVMPPQAARFLNPTWAFNQVAEVLRQKNTEELYLPAQAPPPQAEPPKGIPSPTGNVQDPSQQNGQMNPEALSAIFG